MDQIPESTALSHTTTTKRFSVGIQSYPQGEFRHAVRIPLGDTNVRQATDLLARELHSLPIAFRICSIYMGPASPLIRHVPVDWLGSMKLAKPSGLER